MSQKSYDGKATLYLIPTPIGNMDDITLRAIKILNEVEVIFSEDTRVTSLLLNHLNIKKKLISSHKYNEAENASKLLQYLEDGYDVGLVTDRGTPIISDPGEVLSKIAIENGYNVVGLPGATALIPALITSGITSMPFLYYGFLDHKEGKKKKELEELKRLPYTLIIYEAPHRLTKTLEAMLEVLGNRNISISREISKKHEEIYRGNIKDLIEETKEVKGEIVIVIEPAKKSENNFENLSITYHVNMYIKEGYSSKEAIKLVAHERNVNKNEVYMEYHKGE